MKISVCISGCVRYPEFALKSLNKIKSNEDIKIFIHTWNIYDKVEFLKTVGGLESKEKDKTYNTDFNFLSQYYYQSLLIENYDLKKKDFEEIFSTLKFPKYLIRHVENDEESKISSGIGMLSMYYSIYRANELKREYEKKYQMTFDRVIRMRFDSDFEDKELDLTNLVSDVNIPEGEDWLDGINDQFAVGTSKGIDIYSNFFNEIQNYQHLPYHPEILLKEYLHSKNIYPHRFNFPIKINNGIDFHRFL